MKSSEVHNHIHETYHSLRIGLAALAVALPFILILGGLFVYGIERQGELSAYYFAQTPGQTHLGVYPMRSWFVGILCAIGSFLVLYRGFSNTENWLLNFAGISAVATAIIHMRVPPDCAICGGEYFPSWPTAHLTFAAAFFILMAWVSVACSEETLIELDAGKAANYQKVYDTLAALMVLVVVVVPIGTYLADSSRKLFNGLILPIEIAGIFLFAAYWRIKSREIREIDAQKEAMTREIRDTPDQPVRRTRSPTWRTKAGRILDRH